MHKNILRVEKWPQQQMPLHLAESCALPVVSAAEGSRTDVGAGTQT